MGSTTPILGLPYPVGTDPIRDGDNAIQSLAARLEARLPWGWLGYAQIAANAGPWAAPTVTDILTVPVTVGTGRRIRVTWSTILQQSVSAGAGRLLIKESGSPLQYATVSAGVNEFTRPMCQVILTPTAGAHTYVGAVDTTAGSVGVIGAANMPGFVLVEDIGPATLT